MLFTKTGAENITVTNFQGVRSAQCNAQFDVMPPLPSEPTFNSSDSLDKTWVIEPPVKVPYTMQINSKTKEEKTQAVFITLTVIFIVIIICCAIEVYRTNRAHKKRIERETDEGIIRSKEQATKLHLHESPAAGAKPYSYKAVPTDEEKANGSAAPSAPIVGILKNNGIAGTTILEEPEGATSDDGEKEDEESKDNEPPRGRCATPGPGNYSKFIGKYPFHLLRRTDNLILYCW